MRWVCSFVLMTLVMSPLLLTVPGLEFSPAWTGSMIGICLVVAAISVGYQEKAHRAYMVVLNGVSGSQRSDVVKALWRRQVPTDPVVLDAALDLGETLSKVRKNSSSSLAWPVMWIGMVLFQVYITRSAVSAAGWTLWAFLLIPHYFSDWYVGHRQERHIAALRAAATGQTADSGLSLGKRDRLWLAVIALGLVACAIAFTVTYEREWPKRDCDKTFNVTIAVQERNQLTNGQLVVQGGPSVADYEGWSEQLQRDAAKMTAPDVAPRVRRIADLSVQVTNVVRTAHAAAPTNSAAEVANREAVYQKLIGEMLEERQAIITFCRGT